MAQRREGVYVPTGGSGIPWSINEHHTLVWNGQPYLPAGLRVDGTPAQIKAAKEAGVEDVLVDLPSSGKGWADAFRALEDSKMRYLVRFDSLAAMAQGMAVEPQAYRVAGITTPRQVVLELPGATSAYVVLASKRDSSIQSSGRVPVVNGRLTYEAKPAGEIEHILLVYPETVSYEQPDFWERLDGHRDAVLTALKRNPLGVGLRGIVNPLGRTLSLPNQDLRFVPSSPYFRMELREQLERRYRSIKTAVQSWGIGTHDFETFDDMARLVPLWQGSRGVGMVLDPTTNRLYTCDRTKTNIWSDIREVVSAAEARRFGRLVAAIRAVADVPVIQEWAGWASVYESSSPPLDGLGMRAAGTTPSAIAETASRASSSLLRWSTRGWLVATEVDPGVGADAAAQLPNVIDDLAGLGARGFFVRTELPALAKAVAAEATKRAAEVSLASTSPQAVYFPENALNPATVQRLPGGRWWLPTPDDGNRIDLGSTFSAYRILGRGGNAIAMWTNRPGRYRLRMTNTKTVQFASVGGLDPNMKLVKGGVEVTLSEIPVIISNTEEVPIPEPAYYETMAQFDVLLKEAQTRGSDIITERVYFTDHINGFERNPGGAFPQMRQILRRAASKVGRATWVEAERSTETNFSEAESLPGCSGGGALALRTGIPAGAEGYFADFSIQVKTKEEQEVWIAAKIPAERRGDVRVIIDGQTLSITTDPLSSYGQGFAWYKLGTTRLAGTKAALRFEVKGAPGVEIGLDVLLLTPRAFRPSGINPPDPVDYPPLSIKG